MDFAFTPEQEMFRKTVRDFTDNELKPQSAQWDKNEEFPREAYKQMARLGILGANVPQKFGGMGMDCITAGISAEEIGRGDMSCAQFVVMGGLMGGLISEHASPRVQEEWLPRFVEGEVVISLALTEPGAGSDAANLQLKAEKDGDQFVLNGEKTSITTGYVCDASIVFARTDPSAGARGVTAFFVPMDQPGIERTKFNDLGHRAVVRGSLFFDNVRVPADHILSVEGQGFYQVMKGFDFSRALLGLMCIGCAEQTVEDTIQYVKERSAFGRPIAKFEGVSFPIAEALTMLDAAKWQCYRTLWLKDNNLPHTIEAAMCKWWGPKISVDIIHEMLLLHGHYGYTDEFPVEQRLRDVIGMEIGDGTAQVCKIVIARETIGKEYRPY